MFKDVSDDKFKIIEIYPYIYVYKNLFDNIDEIYSILKNSHDTEKENFFNNWSQWSIFGDYLNPVIPSDTGNVNLDDNRKYLEIQKIEADTELKQKQKNFLIHLLENFYIATEDYAIKHNIDIDQKTIMKSEEGGDVPLWRMTGPTICRYHISDENKEVGMRYHTDFIREQQHRPGYKFVITALAYFNDDYVGGELDFAIGNKLIKYKPEAGDYVVFPSGHPEILSEDGTVYIHGVMPSEGTHKYFSRIYWQKYYEGSAEWFEKEKEFGKKAWLDMQPELEEKFRIENPQRTEIEGGIRIT